MTNQNNTTIKFYKGEQIPVELHKVRIVQKLHLRPIDERAKAMEFKKSPQKQNFKGPKK